LQNKFHYEFAFDNSVITATGYTAFAETVLDFLVKYSKHRQRDFPRYLQISMKEHYKRSNGHVA